jgi:hypothetical protein
MAQPKITGEQVDAGTGANQLVQLDGSGALPAVDGTNLTGVGGASIDMVTDTLGYPLHDVASLSLDSVIAAPLTFESVGPTGSGADNIWTALDGIPTSADWITLRVLTYAEQSAGTAGNLLKAEAYARKHGTSLTANSGTVIAEAGAMLDTAGKGYCINYTQATVPLDGSNLFDITYRLINETFGSCDIRLVGYGVNG